MKELAAQCVTPAKAGVQQNKDSEKKHWVPACAGMTNSPLPLKLGADAT